MENYTPEIQEHFTDVEVALSTTDEAGYQFLPEKNYVGGLQQWALRNGCMPLYYLEMRVPHSKVFRVVCHCNGVRARGELFFLLLSILLDLGLLVPKLPLSDCPSPPPLSLSLSLYLSLTSSGAGRTKKLAKQAAAKLVYRYVVTDLDEEIFHCPQF